MRAHLRLWLTICSLAFSLFAGAQTPPPIGPTIVVPGIASGAPMKLIAYGDIRFTDPANVTDTNPKVRRFLIKQVAAEKPLAIFLTGDTPFIGGDYRDWKTFQEETAAWRDEHLYVFPTTGNHETRGSFSAGIYNYRANFPLLKGCLYYAAQMGNVYLISLDMTQSRDAASPERAWLRSQLDHIPSDVDFVFVLDHKPWMADTQTHMVLNFPERNELAMRDMLEGTASKSRAKFIVVNGHIHNYERFEHNSVTYLISGGGGARPHPILVRGSDELYRDSGNKEPPLINYHYLVIQIQGKHAEVKMYRVADPEADKLSVEVRDTFLLDKK